MIKSITRTILVLLVLGGLEYSHCQIIKTVSVEFERELTKNEKVEKNEGRLYYQGSGMTVVRIKEPVDQWVIYEKNDMTIFYPEEKRAFRIMFKFPVSVPFFQALIGVTQEDFGLIDLGYVMSRYEREGTKLLAIWAPPQGASKYLGEFSLEYQDNKLISSEVKDPKGKTISKSIYRNHIRFGFYFVPMEIFTIHYSNSHRSSELVRFKNPNFNTPLPEEIVNFKIPNNIKMERIIW